MARSYRLHDPPPPTGRGLDFAGALNPQQLDVVMAAGGPMLVVAGAGSGKTRTLTWRVARLIDQGVRPEQILLLTFTNRASREMVGRVEELLGSEARRVWGGTFHSIGRRLLREAAEGIGYPPNFGIIDAEDARSLMKQCVHEAVNPTQGSRFPRPGLLVRMLSESNATGRPVDELVIESYPRFAEHREGIERCLVTYQSRKFDYGVMDFDDLLANWLRVLRDDATTSAAWTTRFAHVLVDEYQDTNAVQCELVDRMATGHGNLMVVGDDCQSIYSFRGADFRNILEFPERHPGCATFRLETNYRSTPQILDLANRSIAYNTEQFDKTLRPVRADGPLPAWVQCRDEAIQAAFVAQRVLELREEGASLDRIAVLYRAHWQSMELQLELGRRNIPYRVHSGQRFFEQRHVKDVLAFARFLENPRDELSFQRLALLGEGIGLKTARALHAAIIGSEDPLGALSGDAVGATVGRRAAPSWQGLSALLGDLATPSRRQDPGGTLDAIVDRFYEDYALRNFDNASNRLKELQTLAGLAAQHESMGEFLDRLALAGATGVDSFGGDDDDEHLVLTTIHQAKGLEFHSVFVIWLADERFPTARAAESRAAYEEERRLFYVAGTRAEQELYLTAPMMSYERGQGHVVLRESPFVTELRRGDGAVFERWDLTS